MSVLSLLVFASLLMGVPVKPRPVAALTGVTIYGAWHCGNDFCTWSTVRNMTDFNTRNRWLIDRGDGSPSVNLVSLREKLIAAGLKPGPITYPDYLPKGEFEIKDPDGHTLMLAQNNTDTP